MHIIDGPRYACHFGGVFIENGDSTTSSYEGFKFCIQKMRLVALIILAPVSLKTFWLYIALQSGAVQYIGSAVLALHCITELCSAVHGVCNYGPDAKCICSGPTLNAYFHARH